MNTLLQEMTETQYVDLYHVDDAPLADLRMKALSRLGWWAVVLLLAGAVAGYVIVLPDTIQTGFVLKSETPEAVYRFPSTVYIEKMYVRNGQTVKAGEPLLELSAPDIAALTHEVVAAQNNLSSFQQYRTASAQNERRMIETSVQRLREEIALKESHLQSEDRKWASESEKLTFEVQESRRLAAQNRDFFKNGDVSRNDLKQSEATAIRAQNAYDMARQNHLDARASLNRQIASHRLEINGLEKQMEKSENDLRLEAARLQSAVASVRQRITGTYGRFELTASNHLLLKADRPGTVSFAFEGEKEVPAGAILLKMMHGEGPMYAHAQVNSSQIGRIQKDQPVVLKLDAYPVFEFGTARGIVSSVSLTPDEKGQFNVQVRLTDPQNLENRLRMGMQGRCEIVAAERNLYEYLFRKFRKLTTLND